MCTIKHLLLSYFILSIMVWDPFQLELNSMDGSDIEYGLSSVDEKLVSVVCCKLVSEIKALVSVLDHRSSSPVKKLVSPVIADVSTSRVKKLVSAFE